MRKRSERGGKTLAGLGQHEMWFGGCFVWQRQYLVGLNDVLKGSKVSFCEAVAIFDFGRDPDSMWQVQHFG